MVARKLMKSCINNLLWFIFDWRQKIEKCSTGTICKKIMVGGLYSSEHPPTFKSEGTNRELEF